MSVTAQTPPRPSIFRITAAEFRRTAFLGRPPALNSLKKMILNGALPGEVLGGHYFVHVDQDCQPVQRAVAPSGITKPTGNRRADAILRSLISPED